MTSPVISLDTNFLLYCVAYRIPFRAHLTDLFGKYTLLLPEGVIKELDTLARTRGKRGMYARVARDLVREIPTFAHEGSVDDAFTHAERYGISVVGTHDRAICAVLKLKNVSIIQIKNKRRIERVV